MEQKTKTDELVASWAKRGEDPISKMEVELAHESLTHRYRTALTAPSPLTRLVTDCHTHFASLVHLVPAALTQDARGGGDQRH